MAGSFGLSVVELRCLFVGLLLAMASGDALPETR